MKTKYITTGLSIIILLAVTIISGCSKDDGGGDPSPLDEQLSLLENEGVSWVSSGGSVIKDGFDVSDQFAGFKLTVSGFNYATDKSLSGVWGSTGSGTWSFRNNSATTLERNDGVIVTIQSISTAQLVLSFNDPTGTGGRYSSVSGDYTFTLVSE